MCPKIPGIEVILLILTSCYQKNKKISHHPRNVAGLLLWVKPNNFCYYPPPPTESARLTVIPENVCYYPPPPPLNLVGLRRSRKISATTPPPPPLNLPGLRRSRKISATTPPPPLNLVGLRRSRKIGPPQKKSWLRRWQPVNGMFTIVVTWCCDHRIQSMECSP